MYADEIAHAGGSQGGPPEHPRRTLLVFHVNDSTDDQVLFQTACRKAKVPFSWHVADSAEKGISYLQALTRMSESQSVAWPDLIILDVVMPGESGLKVLEYIRRTAELKKLPVVIFSGYANPSLVKEAYNLGANSFLEKPVDFMQTVSLVDSLYRLWSTAQLPSHDR